MSNCGISNCNCKTKIPSICVLASANCHYIPVCCEDLILANITNVTATFVTSPVNGALIGSTLVLNSTYLTIDSTGAYLKLSDSQLLPYFGNAIPPYNPYVRKEAYAVVRITTLDGCVCICTVRVCLNIPADESAIGVIPPAVTPYLTCATLVDCPAFILLQSTVSTLELEVDQAQIDIAALQAISHVAVTSSDNSVDITGQDISVVHTNNLDGTLTLNDGKVIDITKTTCANSASAYYTYSTTGATVLIVAPSNAPLSPSEGDRHIETYTDGVEVVWLRSGGAWVACSVDIAKIAIREVYGAQQAGDGVSFIPDTIPNPFKPVRLLTLRKTAAHNTQLGTILAGSLPAGIITPLPGGGVPSYSYGGVINSGSGVIIPFTDIWSITVNIGFDSVVPQTQSRIFQRINGGAWANFSNIEIDNIYTLDLGRSIYTMLSAGDFLEFAVFSILANNSVASSRVSLFSTGALP